MKGRSSSYIDDDYFHNKFIEYWYLMNEKERKNEEELKTEEDLKENEKKNISEDSLKK